MPLTLILTRHAKSSWGDPALDDFDRPLNDRGRKSARAIGRWLADIGVAPDRVLVSGARRTVETWEGMAAFFDHGPVMESAPALYLASPETILSVIRAQTARSLMVICHNPGIAGFAGRMAREAPPHERYSDYPTGATTVMTFEGDTWKDIGWGNAEVVQFTVPKDLTT